MREITTCTINDPLYPELLKKTYRPPSPLYVRGTLPKSEVPALAIVGTRRASGEGKYTARKFAREMAGNGWIIVSGLAFGIDAAAHEGCLQAGGKTIAVLACGLSAIYPREHEHLAEKIIESGGAIISEYPPGEAAMPYRFIERNRIISGLSKGTLVIEAPEGSGSLATAEFSLSENREVFAVPGPIASRLYKGSHLLIRQGAELVTKAEDILEAYGLLKARTRAQNIFAANDEEKQILEAMQEIGAPADIDKIIAMTKLEPRIVSRALSFLIIEGVIKEDGAGYTI